ncbi:outer membrane protein [Rhizobium sp. YTU87027]|uniref:outer membrane protein n=1 Tax=Rhizobium sp. YTU87027 TaxID=3417741 RepID=UPI003D68BB26
MSSLRISLTLVVTALALPVRAADLAPDLSVMPVAPAPVFSWTGPYAGLRGGIGFLNSDFSVPGASSSDDFNGGLVGGFLGANYQMDSIVIGIEGDLSYTWNKKDLTVLGTPTEAGTDVSGSVVGRVGYAVDRALIFATAGWAATRATVDTPAGDEDKTFNGWTVGAGLDYAFTDNLFGRAEYRYNDYGNEDIQGANVDLDEQVVSAGIGVKF